MTFPCFQPGWQVHHQLILFGLSPKKKAFCRLSKDTCSRPWIPWQSASPNSAPTHLRLPHPSLTLAVFFFIAKFCRAGNSPQERCPDFEAALPGGRRRILTHFTWHLGALLLLLLTVQNISCRSYWVPLISKPSGDLFFPNSTFQQVHNQILVKWWQRQYSTNISHDFDPMTIFREGMLFSASRFPGYSLWPALLIWSYWHNWLNCHNCEMCRERFPGYKYFIFTDEDVTLKVGEVIIEIIVKWWRWTIIRESFGRRMFQPTLGEDLKNFFSTFSLGSAFAGVQEATVLSMISIWDHPPCHSNFS